MKAARLSILTVLFAVIASGCASTKQLVQCPDLSKHIDNPAMSRIYVARPAVMCGAVPVKVFDGDLQVGASGPFGYLCWERNPGDATIRSESEKEDAVLKLTCTAGSTYYIRQRVYPGLWSARSQLVLVDEAAGRSMVSNCRPAQAKK